MSIFSKNENSGFIIGLAISNFFIGWFINDSLMAGIIQGLLVIPMFIIFVKVWDKISR